MLSGQFGPEGLQAECPAGYEKVSEGFAAVLFPPATRKNAVEPSRPKLYDADDCDGVDGEVQGQSVFYNPAQVVNRDLSVCAIEVFSQLRRKEHHRKGGTGANGITILEALSASGLRAIRYFKEVTGVRYVIANDLDRDAVECIQRNCAYNAVPVAAPILSENFPLHGNATGATACSETCDTVPVLGAIIPNHDDAIDLMHRLAVNPNVHLTAGAESAASTPSAADRGARMCRLAPTTEGHREAKAPSIVPLLQQELVDCVDLDPYGSAAPFLDSAMRCIREGGLMLVTSTDSAILCGNYPDTCHAKYHSVPHKGAACHEMAVRLLLACIERSANRHQKVIVPILSLHIDFYVRCFFRVYTQQAAAKLSATKLAYQLQCASCPAFWVRPLAWAREKRGSQKSAPAVVTNAGSQPVRAPLEEYPEIPSFHANAKVSAISLRHFPTLEVDSAPALGESSPAPAAAAPRKVKTSKRARNEMESHDDGNSDRSRAGKICPVCGSFVVLSGPIYAAPTQNTEFLSQLLQVLEKRHEAKQISAYARIKGLVTLALGELPRCPLYYSLPEVSSYVKVRCPSTPLFVASLARHGYTMSQVHCDASGVKTNCPPQILVAAMRAWKAQQLLLEDAKGGDGEDRSSSSGQCGTSSSARESRGVVMPPCAVEGWWHDVNAFDFRYDRQFDWRGSITGEQKFIPNAPGWGPKRRHQGIQREQDMPVDGEGSSSHKA